jgi:hypothetical protein
VRGEDTVGAGLHPRALRLLILDLRRAPHGEAPGGSGVATC